MRFRIETFLNQYLSPGSTRADAVFSLTAEAAATAEPARRVVGLLADRSGSMGGEKMEALKHALRVAVDQMDAGVEAFVVAFNARASTILPLTAMDDRGKRAAHLCCFSVPLSRTGH